MVTTEEKIQKTVVSLEIGELAAKVWRAVFVVVALALSVYYVMNGFRGLACSQAMDQAQIGREVLRGHGFTTKFARPLAIGDLLRQGRDIRTGAWVDTYNAPIPPLLDAAAIALPYYLKLDGTFGETMVSPSDRAIAIMQTLFFLGSCLLLFQVAKELFDRRLAYMAVGLTLICDMMWRYALSGLPQMFLLLMLHLNAWLLLRAMREEYSRGRPMRWVAAAGAGFGVMALSHSLSIFIFLPVLVFAFFFFRRRGMAAWLMLAIFLAMYVPWLVRNAQVCGDFRGVARYTGLDGIVHTEAGHMRRFDLDITGVFGNYYAQNFRLNLVAQVNRLFEYMGWSFVAPLALVSVLHAFRRPITATFRWLLFAMWASAIVGMGIYGMKDEQGIAANQFYLLFVPLFLCYGMAYVMVQWDRRIGLGFILPQWGDRSGVHYFLRKSLVVFIVIISGMPLLMRLFLDRTTWLVQWPPYTPPVIALMNKWFNEDEIIASDMPWAVAWYGDRRSLWLPYQREDVDDLSDYRKLGGKIAAVHFTPISGTMNTLLDLVHGEYSRWTQYIVRTITPEQSPFPFKLVLGVPDCVLYMDRDREASQDQMPEMNKENRPKEQAPWKQDKTIRKPS